MKTKERVARLAGSFLMILVLMFLFACKGKNAQGTESVQLSVWGWQGDLEDAWKTHLIPDFEAANPGVKVDLLLIPWDQYWQKVQTSMVSNSLPDIMIMSVALIDQYAKNGALVDLKPYIDRDIDRGKYYDAGLQTVRWPSTENGDEYAFPWNIVCNALFFNTSIFDDAGESYPTADWTLDDLLKAARRLTKNTGNPATTTYGFATNYDYTVLDSLIYSYGGCIVSPDLKTSKIDSPEAIRGIHFLADMMLKENVSPFVSTSGDSMNFGTGRVAMEISGAWALDAYGESSKFSWDIMPVPTGPQGRKIRAWSDSIGISKNSKNPEKAWDFIKFFVSEKGQTVENLTGTRIPILISAANDTKWLQPNSPPAHKRILVDYLSESSPFVFRGGWNEWNTVVANEVLLSFIGEKSVEQAASDAKTAIQEILDRQ
jgi:multiple sugar transport system substrate-binding protein